MTAGRKPRVVVTGAAGTIGRQVIGRLATDYSVLGLVRHRDVEDGVQVARVDLAELDQTVDAFAGAAAVVHLAAVARFDAPWNEVLRDNIVATYNVFEAARRQGVDRVVFASSHHVVGMFEEDGAPGIYDLSRQDQVPVTAEVRPDSLYAVSKAYGEDLGRFFHERHGMAVVCLRIGYVTEDDDPMSESVAEIAPWLGLTREEKYARMRAVWLSKRDAAELVLRALRTSNRWVIAYGTSANPRVFWDPTTARNLLGFTPQDGAPA